MSSPALALLVSAALAGEPVRLGATEIVLDNGLRVVLLEDHAAPVVALMLMVQAGAADDPRDRAGAMHLLEHVLFTGSRSAPGQSLDLALAEIGGDANAWTHYDHVAFTTLVPPGALERALFLEADRLGWPTIDPEQLDIQRGVVRAEAGQALDTPHGLDAASLAMLLYGAEHPYGRTLEGVRGPGGDRELSSLDADLLRRIHGDLFAPSRCVLALVGDLDSAQAEAWVRRDFGALPDRVPAPRAAPVPPPVEGERRWWLPADVGDERLYLAWPGVPRGHADEPAMAILAWLLAGSVDSRLGRRLVEGGPASTVAAWSDGFRVAGGLVIAVSTPDAHLERARRGVDREIAGIASRGVTAGELARARGAWRGSWLRAVQTPEARAEVLAQCTFTTGSADCLADRLARYQAVTTEDLQRLAQGLVEAEGRVLLSVSSARADALSGSKRLVLP